MTRSRFPGMILGSAIMAAILSDPTRADGQDAAARTEPPAPGSSRPAEADESLRAIDADFNRQLVQLERRRLGRLSRLAAGQAPAEAGAPYEQLFRLAIATNQSRDAEGAAVTLLKTGNPSPTATAL